MLDVGTGNGALLFKLVKRQVPTWLNLVGMDYSDNSISLAKKVQQKYIENTEETEKKKQFESIQLKQEDAFQLVDEGKYDIIHDKGTFDVIYMNQE